MDAFELFDDDDFENYINISKEDEIKEKESEIKYVVVNFTFILKL